jgi:Tfp pilus assembly protein PilV
MTIVEVVVAALLVGLIGLSLIGLEAVGRTTADQRVRGQAVAVAQQDQERLRGMTADQLAKLNQTRTVTVDGTVFTVTSTGSFLSSSSGGSSCSGSGAAADYAKVASSVTWANNRRTPVVEQSVVTPNAGGSLVVQTIDQTGAPLQGVGISTLGTDQNTDSTHRSASTDTTGCAVFGGLTVGDYSVTAGLTGFVDADGNSAPSTTVTTTAGNTAISRFTLGQAGAITAPSFKTTMSGTTCAAGCSSQLVPALSWTNVGMATPGFYKPASPVASITTPKTLFPFTTGVGSYTGNYSVWAGRCTSDQPASSANLGVASVAPNTTYTIPSGTPIELPGMNVIVNYKTLTTTTRVKPTTIKLTDACGDTWNPPISSSAATANTGSLQFPGQPYSAYSTTPPTSPGYTICADYKPASTSYKKTLTNVSNTNYTAGTTSTLLIDSTSSANQGTC